MTDKPTVSFGIVSTQLHDCPINSEWILEGNPKARVRLLSASPDGTAKMIVWDCTGGRFNWFYNVDEMVYIVEGNTHIKDHTGLSRLVGPGDTIFFPAGSSAEWLVDKYVRKFAVCRDPIPRYVALVNRLRTFINGLVPPRMRKAAPVSVFGDI